MKSLFLVFYRILPGFTGFCQEEESREKEDEKDGEDEVMERSKKKERRSQKERKKEAKKERKKERREKRLVVAFGWRCVGAGTPPGRSTDWRRTLAPSLTSSSFLPSFFLSLSLSLSLSLFRFF